MQKALETIKQLEIKILLKELIDKREQLSRSVKQDGNRNPIMR
jgi:hypothetical protein